ncbi:MAG: hypothetical protein ACKV0T_06480 [Planctomycetales bacterium]
MTTQEIVRKGEELYDRELRARVEPEYNGQFLVLDVMTGDYEIDENDVIASDRILEKNAEALLYFVRIGFPAAYRIGGCRPRGLP